MRQPTFDTCRRRSGSKDLFSNALEIVCDDCLQPRRRDFVYPRPHGWKIEIIRRVNLGECHRTASYTQDSDCIDERLLRGRESRTNVALSYESAETLFVEMMNCKKAYRSRAPHWPSERHQINGSWNLVDHSMFEHCAIHRNVVWIGPDQDWCNLIGIRSVSANRPNATEHVLNQVGCSKSRQCFRRTRWVDAPNGRCFGSCKHWFLKVAKFRECVGGSHYSPSVSCSTAAPSTSLTSPRIWSH